jgi:hypothetical protein
LDYKAGVNWEQLLLKHLIIAWFDWRDLHISSIYNGKTGQITNVKISHRLPEKVKNAPT